jgi:prefoldin subunit 2
LYRRNKDYISLYDAVDNRSLAMPPKASTSQKLAPNEVPVVFQRYRTELQNLAQKIGELESEMEEHA